MNDNCGITDEMVQRFEQAYQGSALAQAMTRALHKNAVEDIACVQTDQNTQFHFSIDIPTMAATSQKKSGRCWLFAALNLLREEVAKKYNLESFELSQNYMAFWDKFEKINYFLESMIDLAHAPTEDRVVTHLLQNGIGDGGQWDMFCALVEKYGVVPKGAMEETFQSSNTRNMSKLIENALTSYTVRLRTMAGGGADRAALEQEKQGMLQEMYGFLCTCFGKPPKTFDFEYVDKEKKYGIVRGLTPMTFYRQTGMDLSRTVSLINAPTKDKPFHRTFTVDYVGNVVGKPILYLNIEMDALKKAIIRQLQQGQPVWFGSDAGKFSNRQTGVWDDQAFNYEDSFGIDFHYTKETGLDYRQSAMNHAMVITGVNLDEKGNPTKWKIENSWGEDAGRKGYFVMSDSWFDRFTYQAVVRKDLLPQELQKELEQEPIHLRPWDPMGTLAD